MATVTTVILLMGKQRWGSLSEVTLLKSAILWLYKVIFSFSPLVVWDRVSACSPGCPGTHSVDQAGFELTQITFLCLRVLGLEVCAKVPSNTLPLSVALLESPHCLSVSERQLHLIATQKPTLVSSQEEDATKGQPTTRLNILYSDHKPGDDTVYKLNILRVKNWQRSWGWIWSR